MAHVLIVEDDPQIRTLLQETLQLEGYETSLAGNGDEALEQHGKLAPDAIVTDILMPDKEGLSLITDLRKIDKDVCIIAISGGAHKLSPECNLELARLFGANHTFQKPLDLDAMLAVLKESLAKP